MNAPSNPPSVNPLLVKEMDHLSPLPQVELLLRLERGLNASQEALLSRDLPRMRALTAEQTAALRSIALNSARGEASQAVAIRILHLGRVHLALLRRAQQSLRVVSNFLAGEESSYEAHSGYFVRATRQTPGSEEV